MHQLTTLCSIILRFSFELRTMKMMSFTVRSQSKDNLLIDCELSNLIIDNNSALLRTILSSLSDDKRREVLNKVDSYGNTCLGLACNNDVEGGILDVLIENGASVNQSDFYGQTPLQYACLAESVEVIDFLIKAGADVNFIEERYAALHTAASKGNAAILRKLLQAGANVNILTKRGVSPLHCAIESGNLDCAKTLLEHGASTNFTHDLRRKSQSLAFADPLLILATGLGDIEAVELLLNFGAKANSFNYYGMTALNVSCNRRLNKITKMLLRHGSDVNLPDRTGSIPLHYAARHGDVELVEMILKKGGQRNILDVNGESPLNHAIRSQNIEVIKLLLQYGYCTNLYNPCIKDSHPPILRATCSFNDPRVFEEVLVMLIHNDCDINASVPKTYVTALYKALDLRKNHIAKVLLKHNARTDVECPHGLTILNMACQRNMRDVIEFMCRLGTDLNKEDWLVRGRNWTCLTNQELGRSFFETPDPSVPTIFWNKMPLYRILKNYMLSVQSLQSLCRYAIRKCISKKFQEGIYSLVLPQSLKNFLMLEDMDL